MEHLSCREIIHGSKTTSKEAKDKSGITYGRGERRAPQIVVQRNVCLGYSKSENARFTSHLDTMRLFLRALRRANIPLMMSQGFHAHPKVSSGPPLALGYTSRAEYLTMAVRDRVPQELESVLNRYLPDGFEVFGNRFISEKGFSLNGWINTAVYRVTGEGLSEEELRMSIQEFLSRNSYRVTRVRKDQEKEVDIRPFVSQLSISDGVVGMELRLLPEGTARVDEVIGALQSPMRETMRIVSVERTGLYIEDKGRRRTPLENL